MKNNKMVNFSATVGILYSLYLIFYFSTNLGELDGFELVGGVMAVMLVLPHILVHVVATIFSLITAFTNKKWSAITAMILYFVSGVIFTICFIFYHNWYDFVIGMVKFKE